MPRRLVLSFLFVLFISFNVQADPVLPSGTVIGGTITANSIIFRSIEGNLVVLDPNGNIFLVGFASQGGSLDFIGVPGTPIVFSAGIAGSPDQGNVAIQVVFQGTGPVIPNVNTPTLDLVGTATVSFAGTVFATHQDMFIGQNPLFTISGTFTGPVALHLTLGADGFYQLRTATLELNPVPEPMTLLLFGSGLSLAAASRRFFGRRRR